MQSYIIFGNTNQFLKYLDVIEDKKDIETYCGMKNQFKQRKVLE